MTPGGTRKLINGTVLGVYGWILAFLHPCGRPCLVREFPMIGFSVQTTKTPMNNFSSTTHFLDRANVRGKDLYPGRTDMTLPSTWRSSGASDKKTFLSVMWWSFGQILAVGLIGYSDPVRRFDDVSQILAVSVGLITCVWGGCSVVFLVSLAWQWRCCCHDEEGKKLRGFCTQKVVCDHLQVLQLLFNKKRSCCFFLWGGVGRV
jgi:hypothetical protein